MLLLVLASTWPLARHGLDHLPLGTESVATVPLFNVWTIWWNADRAVAGYRDYWNAPIFHPAEGAFAFSEPQPLSVIAAPIIWLSDNRILAYNFLVVFYLWMNGWVACRLLRRIHLHPIAIWSGGAMVALMPLVHSWLGVLQLIPVFGILLCIQALYQFGRNPGIFQGALLGLSMALTYLLCSYYGLFLAIILIIPGIWLSIPHLKNWRTSLSIGIGVIIFLIACMPVIIAQNQGLDGAGMTYDPAYIATLSARPANYLNPIWPHPLNSLFDQQTETISGFRLNPGYIKMALAFIGISWGVFSLRRRWTLLLLTISFLSFFLSLGPNLEIAGFRPYLVLIEWVPGLSKARNVFRFAILTNLTIALLAAFGLHALIKVTRQFATCTLTRKTTGILVTVVSIVPCIEMLPPSQNLYHPPEAARHVAWVNLLLNQPPDSGAIACIPFAMKPDVVSYEREASWMYLQTFHRRPMVNGYSGFFPAHFSNLKWTMAQFPLGSSVDSLLQSGVHLIVVDRKTPHGHFVQQMYRQDQRIELILQDNHAAVDIYRLHAPIP